MNTLDLIKAPSELHKIVREVDLNKLPPTITWDVLLSYMDELKPEIIDEVSNQMKKEGLPFALIKLSSHESPCCITHFKNNRMKIIIPPFIYITTPELVAYVSTNGIYVWSLSNNLRIYNPKYKIIVDDKGYPYYDGIPLADKDSPTDNIGDISTH